MWAIEFLSMAFLGKGKDSYRWWLNMLMKGVINTNEKHALWDFNNDLIIENIFSRCDIIFKSWQRELIWKAGVFSLRLTSHTRRHYGSILSSSWQTLQRALNIPCTHAGCTEWITSHSVFFEVPQITPMCTHGWESLYTINPGLAQDKHNKNLWIHPVF